MNINILELTLEEAQAILCDERLILASREEVLQGQAAITEVDTLRAQLAAMTARAERAEQAAIDLAKEVEIRSILEHVEREHNTLAAQLAEASKRAEKAESESSAHIGKQALKELLRQMLRNAEQKEALAARVAELEGALQDELSWARAAGPCQVPFVSKCMCPHCVTERSKAVLARTAPQSLALVKAAALREFAQWADDQTKDEEESFFRGITTADDAREWANQLETEASKKENDHASY